MCLRKFSFVLAKRIFHGVKGFALKDCLKFQTALILNVFSCGNTLYISLVSKIEEPRATGIGFRKLLYQENLGVSSSCTQWSLAPGCNILLQSSYVMILISLQVSYRSTLKQEEGCGQECIGSKSLTGHPGTSPIQP